MTRTKGRKRNRDESTNSNDLEPNQPFRKRLCDKSGKKGKKLGELILAEDIESLRHSKNIANFSGMKNLIRIAVDNGKVDILDFLHNTPAGQKSYGVSALAQRSVQ